MKSKIIKWVAKIFCISLVLCVLQVCLEKGVANAYTGHTVDEGIAWAASKVGQSLEGDNYYGTNNSCAYQCVDFIICYYKYLGVAPSTGNGCDYATNALPSGWTRVKGGQPQRGDILVYSESDSNLAGHVAIYESDRSTYHQNIGENRKVTHETFQYNELRNPYWGYIRPDWTTAHNPMGIVDSCGSSGAGKLQISGWAFDEDNYGAQLEIHVYVGPEDNASGYNMGVANTYRPDVDNVYHCGQYHGFNKIIDVDRTGSQRVRIFAINVGGGNNQLLYDNTVYIESDNEKPELWSYAVKDLGEHSYSMRVTGIDNTGITKVKFAVKLEDGTSDFVWYDGNCVSSDAYFDESISYWDFTLSNGNAGEIYTTDVYMYDAAGNCTNFSIPSIKLGLDTEAPIIKSSSRVYQDELGVVNLYVDLLDNYGLGTIYHLGYYRYSQDKNSGLFLSYGNLVKREDDCWSSYVDAKPIVASEKSTEIQETVSCNGIVHYYLLVSDLAGNSCDIDLWTNGEVKGKEKNSKEIMIKSGERIKIKDINEWGYEIRYDENNQRILKKTSADDKNDVELIGNEPGVEYVYFINYLSRDICSCKIIVNPDKKTEDGLITSDNNVTSSSTQNSDEVSANNNKDNSTATPFPTATQIPEATTKPSVAKNTPTLKPWEVKAPGKVNLKKAKALGKGKVKISWKWLSNQDGYQVQCAMNRSFTKKRKTQYENSAAEKAKFTNLKKGKTYYFRVRAYNRGIYGKDKYGKWSNIKKIKVK
ncbi:MAG: fibronectin type III domain-containing protein [Ruminococcus flavefaciens]|nr:fibronectin type III domain-containing protein [Ruminococcus flavefaciens]